MNVTEINKNRDYIPEEVLDNINPNEKILFRLRSSHISKSTKVSAIAFICVAIFGVVVIFFILSLLAKDPDLDIINIIFILVLIGVVILMIYNAIPSLHRKIQYLILTNKNFYFQINDRKEHRQFYNLMDNNSLITITKDRTQNKIMMVN